MKPVERSGAAPSARAVAGGGRTEDVSRVVAEGLAGAAARLEAAGVPVPALDGKLLRPLVAYALVPPALRERVDERFWSGALAVQMVHEASLLHDDILDDASERRGRQTLYARGGVGPALVLGDHWLTGSYRAAAATGAPDFLDAFIRGVERTVAGEVAQGRSVGRRLAPDGYREIVTGKSGELFGAAAALGGALFGLGRHEERIALGLELGALYQQVDDLLDYCTAADTGKAPFQDYRQRKWTWVLDLAGVDGFDLDEDALLARLFAVGVPTPARRALALLEERRDALVARAAELSPGDAVVAQVVGGWVAAARGGVEAQEAVLFGTRRGLPGAARAEAEVAERARAVGGPDAWPAYFGRHARTFRFAARLFPPEPAALISGVYAFCRFTDDLVDAPWDDAPAPVVEARLEAWGALARQAFEGRATGIPILDVVLGEAGRRGVSWRYPDALLAGVGMDLTRHAYADWETLEEYTFGVAGAVGGWITQLFGMHDEALLRRAHALGHAMQLTNIARDVGEDLKRGRVYLPACLLRRHGFDVADLARLAASEGPLPRAWRELVEELIARAEARYEEAWPGIQALPTWYRRPVAVAAEAYRGIHAEIRAKGHDNLRRRASTSGVGKMILAASGLWRARG